MEIRNAQVDLLDSSALTSLIGSVKPEGELNFVIGVCSAPKLPLTE